MHFSATSHCTLEQEIEFQTLQFICLGLCSNAFSSFKNVCVAKCIGKILLYEENYGLADGPEECLLAELRYISGGGESTSKRTSSSREIVTSD